MSSVCALCALFCVCALCVLCVCVCALCMLCELCVLCVCSVCVLDRKRQAGTHAYRSHTARLVMDLMDERLVVRVLEVVDVHAAARLVERDHVVVELGDEVRERAEDEVVAPVVVHQDAWVARVPAGSEGSGGAREAGVGGAGGRRERVRRQFDGGAGVFVVGRNDATLSLRRFDEMNTRRDGGVCRGGAGRSGRASLRARRDARDATRARRRERGEARDATRDTRRERRNASDAGLLTSGSLPRR